MFATRARTALLGLALAASMGLGVVVGFSMPDDDLFELRKSLRIFGAVYEEVVTGYVERVDPTHLMEVGVDAMLEELDPYTVFVDESENARLDMITEGQYGGVGLEVGRRGGEITVVSTVSGVNWDEKGIRTGDVLREVAGQPTDDLSPADVETLLRGEPGTTVRVTVERQGTSGALTFTLARKQVDPPDVTYRGRIGDADQLGYVKLDRFTRDAPSEVETALEELQASEALQGVVLDLRDNPGGLLRAAVQITELFVPQGSVIVSTKGRGGEDENAYASDRVPLLPDVPVVVLVNDQSASASEIVAGALQDYDRGVVMGTTTYGKGLVQNVRSLPHNTALKLTTAQYYTPSGRTIQALTMGRDSGASAQPGRAHQTTGGRTVRDGDGIRPDVRVPGPRPHPLEQALTRRAAFFRYANHYAATRDTLAPGFTVTDADLEAFQEWLDTEGIEYPTRAERSLDSVTTQIEAQGYEEAGDEAAALAEALQSAKTNAFDRHASDLKQHLKRETLSRYVSAGRRIEALLPTDTQVGAATDLLRDSDRYEQILSATDE